MIVLRAFKTELDLSNGQRTACAKHAGAARYAYNWGLARKKEAYGAGLKMPTAINLHRELNVLKKTELSWMYEASKCSPQESLRNLDEAYARFFRRVEEKKAGKKVKVGFPKFKSKKNGLGGFRLTGAIHVFDDAVQLPRLGRLRLKERGYLPTRGAKVLSAAVSERAGRWYVSIPVEMEMPEPAARDKPVVGVDLGVRHLATLSDGVQFENPRALRNDIQRIKRLQRMVSRREKGSQPEEGGRSTGKSPPARGERPQGRAPSGHHPAGENQVGGRAGGPERKRLAPESSSGAGDCRCRPARIQAAIDLQR